MGDAVEREGKRVLFLSLHLIYTPSCISAKALGGDEKTEYERGSMTPFMTPLISSIGYRSRMAQKGEGSFDIQERRLSSLSRDGEPAPLYPLA